MVYAVIGLTVVLLGTGIGLSIWIAKLKDQLSKAQSGRQSIWQDLQVTQTNLKASKAHVALIQKQLKVIRRRHEDLCKLLEDGSLSEPGSIAAELSKLFSGK